MTSPETTILRQRLARLITHRASSSTDLNGIVEAATATHQELKVVFAPLIGSAGVAALSGRAFDLTRREYGSDEDNDNSVTTDDSFDAVSFWLNKQVPSVATEAAAALFATFAELLGALIGEPLTMRYLEKAWPRFSEVQAKGKKT